VLRYQWEEFFPTWQLCVGTTTAAEGPWVKAVATERAIEQTDAQILVVADADVWCAPPEALAAAVDAVANGEAPWAVPHSQVRRLNEAATAYVLDGHELGEHLALSETHYRGMAGGGLAVFSRKGWETIGGFDPRFRGWGGEDSALGKAADTILGRHKRFDGVLWHYWHEPAPRLSRTKGSDASNRLLMQYRRAVGRPALMRSLLNRR